MSASPHLNGGSSERTGVLEAWLGVLRRRWAWGMGVGAVVVGAAALLLFTTHPVYRAEARLRLGDPPPMTGLSPSGGLPGLFRLGGDPFSNDLEVLGSRSLREAVVEELALNVRLLAPRHWHRDSLVLSLAADRATPKATYQASWTTDGRLEVQRTAPTDSLVGTFETGVPVRFGGMTVAFRPRPAGAPERFQIVTQLFGDAVRSNQGRIVFERASREANVLDLRYDDPDPALARAAVASVLNHFVALRTALNTRESTETVDSLRVVAGHTLVELRDAEERLEELQRTSGLVAAEAQSEALVERYGEVQGALEAARAELDLLTTALARVDAAENPGSAWISLVAHPRFLENQTVGDVLARLTLLEEQRLELAARRAPANIELETVTQQIALLDGTLRSLVRSYRTGLEEQVAVLERRMAEMNRVLASTPGLTLEVGRRQRDVRLLNEVVVLTEQRLRQEELRQALTFANVQVIDQPALLSRPVWPRKRLGLAVALLLAAGFGTLAMLVVERADGSVRSAWGLAGVVSSPLVAAVHNGGGGGLHVSAHEAQALLRRGRIDPDRRSHLQLLSVDSPEDARALAGALEGVSAKGTADALTPAITLLAAVDSYSAATEAAARDEPIVLVLRAGATERRDLERVVRLLEGAGARVAGSVMLCRNAKEARIAWI